MADLFEKHGIDFKSKGADLFEKHGIKLPTKQERAMQAHPMIAKLAEALQSTPRLNKAVNALGDVAGHFNRATEGTGLPNAARDFLQSGSEVARGLGNLIPGVNLRDPKFSELPIEQVNPLIQSLGSALGGLAGYATGAPIYKGSKALLSAGDIIPEFAKRIGSSALTGAAISPDNRVAGAALGAALPGAADFSSKAAGIVKDLPATLKQNPKDLAKNIQQKHDIVSNKLENEFKSIDKAVNDFGINKVSIPKDILDIAKDFLPKTRASRSLIEKAQDGEYSALRKIQADLRTKAEKALSSDLISENDLGHEMLELRNDINDSIENHFVSKGHPDLAERLNKVREGYKHFVNTYYSHPKISKLVGKERLIPRNPAHLLSEDSAAINNLKKAHPELEKGLKREIMKNRLKPTKKSLAHGILGALGFKGGEKLLDYGSDYQE